MFSGTRFNSLIMLIFLALLAACGGSGGGSGGGGQGEGSDGNSSQSGKPPSQATANYLGSRQIIEPGRLLAEWLPAQLRSARLVPRDFAFYPVNPIHEDMEVDEKYEGGSGHLTITGEFTASGTDDWFYFEYEDFEDGSVVIDGGLLQENLPESAENQYVSYLDAVYSLYDFQFDFGDFVLQYNGTVEFRKTSQGWELESDLLVEELNTGLELYIADFHETRTFVEDENGSIALFSTFDGAIFDNRLGGVKFSTKDPFSHAIHSATGEELVNTGRLSLFEENSDVPYAEFIAFNPALASLQWRNAAGRTQTVRSDILVEELPDFVRSRSRPLADAGGEWPSVFLSVESKQADGGLSVSYAGKPLQYQWDIVSFPPGSTPELENSRHPVVNVHTEKPGYYGLKLTVDDGELSDVDYLQLKVSSDRPGDNPYQFSHQGLFQVVRASESNPDDERVFIDGRVSPSPSQNFGSQRLPAVIRYANGIQHGVGEDLVTVLDLAERQGAFIFTDWRMRSISTEADVEFHPAIGYLDDVSTFTFIDADRDGVEDLVTGDGSYSDYASGPLRPAFYPGLEAGGFGAGQTIDGSLADHAFSTLAEDLTGDGQDELIVFGSCSVAVYLTSPAGFDRRAVFYRSQCEDYSSQYVNRKGVVEDLDKDGVPTLVFIDGPNQVRFIEVDDFATVKRDETIGFDFNVNTADESVPVTSPNISQIAIIDANADGKLDLVFANQAVLPAPEFGIVPAFTVFHQGESDSSFVQGPSAPASANETFLVVEDVSGDGIPELITGINTAEDRLQVRRVQVWMTSVAGLLPKGMIEWNYGETGGWEIDHEGIVAVELNGEPGTEVLVRSESMQAASALLEFSAEGHVVGNTMTLLARRDNGTGPAVYFKAPLGVVRDMDGDGQGDLVTVCDGKTLCWFPRMTRPSDKVAPSGKGSPMASSIEKQYRPLRMTLERTELRSRNALVHDRVK